MKKKINIMFVNYSVGMGGIETLLLEICGRLNRKIFNPCVCVFSPDEKIAGEFKDIGIPIHLIKKKDALDPKLPFRLYKLIKDLKIDVLHTNNQGSWLYGTIAANIARIPIVHTEHTNVIYHAGNKNLWLKLEKLLSFFTFKITTVAESVANFMICEQNIKKDKIKVIENGIDADIYDFELDKNQKKKEISLKESDIAVGIVARLTGNKAHDVLIKAFSFVVEEDSNAKLVIVGDGPLRNELSALTEKLELNDRVMFLGVRRDIPELLKAFDIFVLSSIREGLPVSILEAMASSLPVVATSVDGNAEVVSNGETGLLVPVNDPETLSKALLKLIKDGELSKQMGINGRSRVVKHYTFDKMIKMYEDIYLRSQA